jgi:hypothetical protein
MFKAYAHGFECITGKHTIKIIFPNIYNHLTLYVNKSPSVSLSPFMFMVTHTLEVHDICWWNSILCVGQCQIRRGWFPGHIGPLGLSQLSPFQCQSLKLHTHTRVYTNRRAHWESFLCIFLLYHIRSFYSSILVTYKLNIQWIKIFPS